MKSTKRLVSAPMGHNADLSEAEPDRSVLTHLRHRSSIDSFRRRGVDVLPDHSNLARNSYVADERIQRRLVSIPAADVLVDRIRHFDP